MWRREEWGHSNDKKTDFVVSYQSTYLFTNFRFYLMTFILSVIDRNVTYIKFFWSQKKTCGPKLVLDKFQENKETKCKNF